MATPAVTALAKLGFGFTSTITQSMNFKEFFPGVHRQVKDTNQTRGTLFKDSNRMRERRQVVKPRYSGTPSAPEWAFWLQAIMCGSPTGSPTVTYPFANIPAPIWAYFLPNFGDYFFLSNVGVNKATMRATSGEDLTLDVDLLGETFTNSTGAYPGLTYDLTLQPFILSDLAVSYNSSTVNCESFSFTIDKHLNEDRYLNSLTLTALSGLDLDLIVKIRIPSGDNGSGVWDSGLAGVAVVATFTNPNNTSVLVMNMPNVVFPSDSPEHAFKGEGFIELTGNCCETVGSAPVVITLHQ